MKVKYLLILSYIFFVSASFAQQTDREAKNCIDKAVDLLAKTSFKSEFIIAMNKGKGDKNEILKGNMSYKANKYMISAAGVDTYFDGKTEWIYTKDINEVTISAPSKNEAKKNNPINLIKNYSLIFKVAVEEDAVPNDQVWQVALYPNDKKNEFFKVSVVINKNNNTLNSVILYSRGGNIAKFSFNKYQATPNISDDEFRFDTAKYPNITINDLR